MPHTVIVTGANSGIGRAASEQLAARGATVVMACRSLERGRAARDAVIAKTGAQEVHLMRVDLGDLASVRAFASDVRERFPVVQALIHNAAVFDISKRSVEMTKDGLETNWATNYVGAWLLTQLLRPSLEAARPGRVIDVTSKGLVAYPFLKVDPEGAARGDHFSPERAYYQSKLALLTHTLHLARTADPELLVAHAIWVPAVKVAMDRIPPLSPCKRWVYLLKRRFALEPEQMAETYTALALDPAWAASTGQLVAHGGATVTPPAAARDPERARALEAATRRMVQGDPHTTL